MGVGFVFWGFILWTNPSTCVMLPLVPYRFFFCCCLNLFSNTVLLQGTQAERETPTHQPQPTSHTDSQLLNTDPLVVIRSPQSSSLSPPPCKVQSHLSLHYHSQVCWSLIKHNAVYLHSNQHPTYQALCQIPQPPIHPPPLQLGSHLLLPCPPSTPSHLPFHSAPVSQMPLQHPPISLQLL